MDPSRLDPDIRDFLACTRFAVVGASNDLQKYGAKVFRCYLQHDRDVIPVHPREATIQGHATAPSLRELPHPVDAVSVITPPAVTEQVVEDAIAAGVRFVWMQPGAESDAAIAAARDAGLRVIAGGPCLLVVMGYRE